MRRYNVEQLSVIVPLGMFASFEANMPGFSENMVSTVHGLLNQVRAQLRLSPNYLDGPSMDAFVESVQDCVKDVFEDMSDAYGIDPDVTDLRYARLESNLYVSVFPVPNNPVHLMVFLGYYTPTIQDHCRERGLIPSKPQPFSLIQ